MADKISKQLSSQSSGWDSFKLPPGGSSQDIRRSVAGIQSKVSEEKKIFAGASLMNGGTRTKS